MYTGFIETYYDGFGNGHYQVIWATNETGQWVWNYLEEADGWIVDVAAGDDGVSYALYGSGTLGTRYGVHHDGEWTWYGVPDVDGTMRSLFFVNGAPTILVVGQDPDYAVSTLTLEGENWVSTDLGINTSYLIQAQPAPDGTWRIADYDDVTETVYFVTNESGEWVGQEVYQQPDVNECAGQGLDAAGRPHVLVETASGWQDVYDDGTQWRVEPVDFGLTGFYNVQMKADSTGTLHVAGYSAGNLIYGHNATGVWQTETVVSAVVSPVLTLRPDDQPAILYRDTEGFHLAERLDGNWQAEIVPSDPDFTIIAADVAVNAAGDAFVCYLRQWYGELHCARRIDGLWSTELVGTGRNHFSPGAMTLDPAGAPHYVSCVDADDTHQVEEIVFRNGVWETANLGEYWAHEIGFAIDGDGVSHLVLNEYTYDLAMNNVYYGNNAHGEWSFGEIDRDGTHLLAPLRLPDATVHHAYFSGGGLWRAVVGSTTGARPE
jgi:hypothetical protein